MALSAEALRAYFQNHFGIQDDEYDNETLLFSSGVLDSFNLVSLMSFIEHEAGFRINPTDVSLDNLDSVNRILEFVTRRSR